MTDITLTTQETRNLKNYVGMITDHSLSMSNIVSAASAGFNLVLNDTITATKANSIDTIFTHVMCGVGRSRTENIIRARNTPVLNGFGTGEYQATGGCTPLFDAIGDVITIMEQVPDFDDKNVAFVVEVTTDGENNTVWNWDGHRLANKIKTLQATDRWTFVVRVPKGGYKRELLKILPIPEGNILEWETSARGAERASVQTSSAMTSFYESRAKGVTSTTRFYADLENVSSEAIKAAMVDISSQVMFWPVGSGEGESIREFCENKSGGQMLRGAAFYRLDKLEPRVQQDKLIAIRDKTTGAVYEGAAARDLLGLPHFGNVRLAPGSTGNFDVFIQSKSVNRKLPAGTEVMWWPAKGTPYIEGKSAKY